MALAVFFKIKTVGRLKLLLKNLDDYSAFDKVIDGAQKYVKEFDEKYYQPFINKITSQCSCKNGFDFFEHSYYSNRLVFLLVLSLPIIRFILPTSMICL